MDPHELRESIDSKSTLCKSLFQSVYNASTPFNVMNFNFENNNVYSAYTSSNDEEQSIYNAVILLKSFTKDAKLSCTLISKKGGQFVDIESTFFKQLYLSEWALNKLRELIDSESTFCKVLCSNKRMDPLNILRTIRSQCIYSLQ